MHGSEGGGDQQWSPPTRQVTRVRFPSPAPSTFVCACRLFRPVDDSGQVRRRARTSCTFWLTVSSIKINITYMKATRPKIEDASTEALARLGSRIRLARMRRKLRQEDLAQQIGRARATVVALEKGSPKTEIGAYAAALWALGLLQELDLVADPGLDRDGQALSFSAADKRVRLRRPLNNKF